MRLYPLPALEIHKSYKYKNMNKKLILKTKTLLTLFKRNNDVRSEFLDNLFQIKRAVTLTSFLNERNNYTNQVRYCNYMHNRISFLISKGECMKALYIYFNLVRKSQSFNNLSFLFHPCSRELEKFVEDLYIKEQRL